MRLRSRRRRRTARPNVVIILLDDVGAIDGKVVGKARVEHTVAGRFGIDTFGVGSDTGSPVTDTYKPPFPFTGKIERVDIELGPRNLNPEDEEKLHEMHTAFAGAHD